MLRVVGAAVVVGVMDDEPVDDDLDRMALVLVERPDLVEVEHLAVDADAHEALLARRLEDAVALRLAVADQRTQNEDARPVGQRQDLVDDLLARSGAVISWPFGQCGWPTRANSRRRWS